MTYNKGNEFVGRQKHILCQEGDVAPYVLLPGDPGRAELISTFFDERKLIAKNREYTVYTGTYKGVPVSVCSTGVGSPSAAIGIEELGKVGAHTFIRVGSAGGLQDEVNPGDICIATAAYRKESTSKDYIPSEYPAVADLNVTLALIQASRELGIPTHVGLCSSGDAFYAPKPPGFTEMLHNSNVLAGEMECSAIFVIASLRRWRAGGILAIDGNIWRNERKKEGSDEIFNKAVENEIRISLEACKILYGKEK
ncbi:nucleoside phosphorylase [Pseudoneobacillus sp. C159]